MWSSLRLSSRRDSSSAAAAGNILETKQGLCQVVLRSFRYDFVCLKRKFSLTQASDVYWFIHQ